MERQRSVSDRSDAHIEPLSRRAGLNADVVDQVIVQQANQAGLDSASRTALHNDFTALRDQIADIVSTAEFNGVNLISSGAANTSVLSSVDGSTIAVSAQSLDTTTLAIQSLDLTSSANAATALTATIA